MLSKTKNPILRTEAEIEAHKRTAENAQKLNAEVNHAREVEKKIAKDEDNSVLWLHSLHHHQGREDVIYNMRVTGSFTESLDRQIMERVQISNFKGPVLMNRRNEMGGVRVERMQYRRWGGNS